MTWTPSDERWMRRALELAQKGQLTTWPNPMVGCVVVENNQILGEGWHQRFGEGHAEVNALDKIEDNKDLSRATAYVTLEPCSHHGKTPPCAVLLTSRGVGRVVVATQDPNPVVAGRGLTTLTEAGIEVIAGCLEKEALELNRRFFFAMHESRPWITLKWAQSRDGFVDPDERAKDGRGGHPLTGAASARHTHTLRATHDGILVGGSARTQHQARPWQEPSEVCLDLRELSQTRGRSLWRGRSHFGGPTRPQPVACA